MAQEQIGNKGIASLACYTVDSDFSSSDEDGENIDQSEKKEDPGEAKDFSDMYIKQEPVDEDEPYCIDTFGHIDPTAAQEFKELQEVKVEIESDAETSDSSSESSSSDDESDVELVIDVSNKDEAEKDEGPPRTKNEITHKDLDPVEDLTDTVAEYECQEIGEISSIVDDLVVIESDPGLPAVDLESILFLDKGAKALGRVFDVIGPVTRPFYVVRFNNNQHLQDKGVEKGLKVYYAPRTEHTTFVFLEQLMKMKISDASWMNDEEPPPQFLEYSDDEEEQKAKKDYKIKKLVESGADESTIAAKKAKLEGKRNRPDNGSGRGRGRGRGNFNNTNGGQPAYCNNMYTAQSNPFYRTERSYDPRQGNITWGQYNMPSQYQYGQVAYYQYTNASSTPTAQSPYMYPGYNNPYTTPGYNNPYTTPPPPTPSTPQQALAGANWHNQYQQLSANISAIQAPPPPPPPAVNNPPPPGTE